MAMIGKPSQDISLFNVSFSNCNALSLETFANYVLMVIWLINAEWNSNTKRG